MQRTQLPLSLQTLLATVPYVALVTVDADGRPWNTPLSGVFDSQLCLYWASHPASRHSRAIARHSGVFVVVYDSRAPSGTGQGLYLRMEANMVKAAELPAALELYTDRFGETTCQTPFFGNCPRRLYRAVPREVWRNDEGAQDGHFIDVRQLLEGGECDLGAA